jgi:hypothetical protein
MKIDAVRLDRYVAIGKKFLDSLWDAIAAKREPWDDGRIRLWLAPRLGRPPWLCGEIWAKYAADRKALAASQNHGQATTPDAGQEGNGLKPDAASHGASSHGKHDSGGKGKRR